MFTQLSKIGKKSLALTFTFAIIPVSWADPPTTPQGPIGPPAVSCFIKTGADALAGGGMQIQFEILNWTDVAADDFEITLNTTTPGLTTGGEFGVGAIPLAGPFSGKINSNDWSLATQTNTFARWIGGTPLDFIDVDPNDDGLYGDTPPLPSPVDSGANALDGFILNLPGLDVGERVVFDWTLTSGGQLITDDNGGFGFGTIQIDRAEDASDGSIRQSTFFSIGSTSADITNVLPLDLGLTNLNATTDPAVGSSVVPIPAAVWLFTSGVIGLVIPSLRRKRSGLLTS